jgi:hypothetical protein
LEVVDRGVLWRNPLPGHQSLSAYLPFVVQLGSGELLAIFRKGSAFYSRDGALAIVRSTDGGATWTDGGLVRDPAADATRYSYTGPFAATLADGTIVLVAVRREHADERLAVNPATGGFLPVETVLFRSIDDGRTWSDPEPVRIPDGLKLDVSGPIVELLNGSWFLPADTGKAYDDTSPIRNHMVGLVSIDRGATWEVAGPIANGAAEQISFFHGRVVRLLDGRLFTLLWARDERSEAFLSLHRVVSDFHGRNWTAPEPTGIQGQTSWAVDLGNDVMVAAYTLREDARPGIRAVLSRDGGRTWDLDQQLIVWDATGRETIGVASADTYPQSHDVIAFGRPVAMRLADGDVLVSYWCTDLSLTQAQWARIRVGGTG